MEHLQLHMPYPWWYLLTALAAGLVIAGVLYFGNRSSRRPVWVSILLFLFRFLSASLLALLLLEPYLRKVETSQKLPTLMVGIDNSASMISGNNDSAAVRQTLSAITRATAQLKDRYRVETWLFGSEVRTGEEPDLGDDYSDYGMFLRHVEDHVANDPGTSVLIVGDGISNRGMDPVLMAQQMDVPIRVIALGDTTLYPDFSIRSLRMNSDAFVGDTIPVEVVVGGEHMNGQSVTLRLSGINGKSLSKNIRFNSDHQTVTVNFTTEASIAGIRQVSAVVSGPADELNKSNNKMYRTIHVTDHKKRVLLLYQVPHPDVTVMARLINQLKKYEVTVMRVATKPIPVEDYDVIIASQLPGKSGTTTRLLNAIRKAGKPVLYTLGADSDIDGFNKLDLGVTIVFADRFIESTAGCAPTFDLFTFDKDDCPVLAVDPPLLCPLGVYTMSAQCRPLLNQITRGISTDHPMWLFTEHIDHRSAILFGEGIWRWNMNEYRQELSRYPLKNLMEKTMEYLSAPVGTPPLVVETEEVLSYGQPVIMQARLRNESNELYNDPELTLYLKHNGEERYTYTFSRDEDHYMLQLDDLNEGQYQYRAVTTSNGKEVSRSGSFVIDATKPESRELTADHRMLWQLATAGGGRVYLPDETAQLWNELAEKAPKPEVLEEARFTDLSHHYLIGLIIVILLAAEWIIRKASGDY